ncbi:DUF4276 family protein [Candidatus Poribacteria bacterium]|nr:DUF4276 family protein [Candidatus Poribacteria bacterium]
MAILKIAYALEGPSDHRIVPILIERLIEDYSDTPPIEVMRSVRRTRRRGHGFVKELPQLVRSLESDETDILVAIVDADAPKLMNERLNLLRETIEKLQPSPICFVMGVAVKSLESWLLADEHAIRLAVGVAYVPQQPAPEGIDAPKTYLDKLIRNLSDGREFSIGRLTNEIASALDLQRFKSRCSHFEQIAQELNRCLQRFLVSLTQRIEG